MKKKEMNEEYEINPLTAAIVHVTIWKQAFFTDLSA